MPMKEQWRSSTTASGDPSATTTGVVQTRLSSAECLDTAREYWHVWGHVWALVRSVLHESTNFLKEKARDMASFFNQLAMGIASAFLFCLPSYLFLLSFFCFFFSFFHSFFPRFFHSFSFLHYYLPFFFCTFICILLKKYDSFKVSFILFASNSRN